MCQERCEKEKTFCHDFILRFQVERGGAPVIQQLMCTSCFFANPLAQAHVLKRKKCQLSSVLFLFLIKKKKLQKRERTCRAYMKVRKLAAVPSCSCTTVSAAACLLCTVTSSLLPVLPAFFWVIALHAATVVLRVLSKSNRSHLQLLRCLLFRGCVRVFLCFVVFFSLPPPSMHWQLWLYFVIHPVFSSPYCVFLLCLPEIARLDA